MESINVLALCDGEYEVHSNGLVFSNKKQEKKELIGRELDTIERIHHINLDKLDNRIENLYLCKNQSSHQRLHVELQYVAGELCKRGVIRFENGHYVID